MRQRQAAYRRKAASRPRGGGGEPAAGGADGARPSVYRPEGGEGPAQDGVEQRGRVSLDELAGLYRRAAALVFPSRYEGFGQPPLEAMASGCPVACSDAASLPEVCGGAARLFDPESPEAIAEAVRAVLDDPEPWRERGLARAAEFTWERSARQHEDAYRALLA